MTKKLKRQIRHVAVGALLFFAGLVASKFINEWFGLGLFAAAYIVTGQNVLKNAGINIIHGRVFDENFLMLVATIGAIVCKEYSEAVAVMLFYQVGECFQTYAVNKSRKSVKALMEIRPDFARVQRNGAETEVDPADVLVGEAIVIRPGERVPLDGVILEGNSSVDTAAITGESLPREVFKGDKVVSGCINLSGVLTVEVESGFAESTVSKVLTLVEDASNRKAKAEQFITVFSRYYTPVVVFMALALLIFGSVITKDPLTWLYRAATFLLISCPCALVISVPLSFFGGIGGAGKQGILIKGGNYMDTLSKIDTLVLDKTGTITKGNFALAATEPSQYFENRFGAKAEERLLEYSAYAEGYSTHPIGLSIISKYGRKIEKSRIGEVTEIAGRGIKAYVDGTVFYVGNMKLMLDVVCSEEKDELVKCINETAAGTVVYVAEGIHFAGHMHIVDEIKPEAVEALQAARTAGIKKILMLTGDNELTAQGVSRLAGLDGFYANLTPVDKVSVIEKIMEEADVGKVAFVGDGINDAPVLSRADIGIAMGAMGSDAAIEAADVVIMTDELSKIPLSKKIAVRTIRIVKENIIFALSVKILVLALAGFGIAHMGAAIFADVGVAFLAIMNSMRALKQ